MGLPWFRMDSNFAAHDKIADLIDRFGAKGKAAGFVYAGAIGYSHDHDTGGLMRRSSLKFVHGTPADARLLVEGDLFIDDELGWRIKNFNKRNGVGMEQQAIADEIKAAQVAGGKKGAEKRWGSNE